MPLTPETRQEIFDKIKTALAKNSPPMVVSKDKDNIFELIGNKPVPYGSKKVMVPGMYFSWVISRKDTINFYFHPMYMHTEEFKDLMPTMFKFLKGKTCFHFKKPEQVNEKELSALLKKGVQAWKKSGYMK